MEKKKIAISTESTCDLCPELIKKYDVHVVPLTIVLGNESGYDGVEVTPERIFEYINTHKDLPRTCAVNEFQYDEFFSKMLEEYDEVIHIALSSTLSSSYSNAKRVSENHPNVHVIDSLNLSTGIGLQVVYAAKLIEKGLDAETIVKKVEARRKYVQASFFVDSLESLYKGGRCSALAKWGAAILRIKPQIMVNQEGKMVPGSKYFGRKTQVAAKYVEDTLNRFKNPDKSLIFVTQAHAIREVVDLVKNLLIEKGFKNIVETIAGSTITTHCGKGSLGILYYNDGGENA